MLCADVTFLAMDLERLDRADAANRLLSDYQELTDDRFPQTLDPFLSRVPRLRPGQGGLPSARPRELTTPTLRRMQLQSSHPRSPTDALG